VSRPPRLPSYIAASARATAQSRSWAPAHCDTPAEKVTTRPGTMSSKEARSAWRTRSIAATASVPEVDGMTSRNSSPPQRASMSPTRTAACAHCPNRCNTASPIAWPWTSLISLKWSMSISPRAINGSARPRTASSSCIRSSAARRFARPVRSSCVASARTRWSASLNWVRCASRRERSLPMRTASTEHAVSTIAEKTRCMPSTRGS
jgi:hypothetical protein